MAPLSASPVYVLRDFEVHGREAVRAMYERVLPRLSDAMDGRLDEYLVVVSAVEVLVVVSLHQANSTTSRSSTKRAPATSRRTRLSGSTSARRCGPTVSTSSSPARPRSTSS